jgi:ribosomal protein S18 acetylase RimI-like enzyme
MLLAETPIAMVRRLTAYDGPALWHLRNEALERDPEAFELSVDEHWRTTVSSLSEGLRRSSDWDFFLGAFSGIGLMGCVALSRNRLERTRHRAVVKGLYVTGSMRRRGVGQELLVNLLKEAEVLPGLGQLSANVPATQTAAIRLLTLLGFEQSGREPDARRLEERSLDAVHLILQLSPARLASAPSGPPA